MIRIYYTLSGFGIAHQKPDSGPNQVELVHYNFYFLLSDDRLHMSIGELWTYFVGEDL